MKQKKLLKYILIAMISGILIGWAFHSTLTTTQTTELAAYFKIVTDVFLRLIKMIIAPLVFATIVSGLVSMGKILISRINYLKSHELVHWCIIYFTFTGHGLSQFIPTWRWDESHRSSNSG